MVDLLIHAACGATHAAALARAFLGRWRRECRCGGAQVLPEGARRLQAALPTDPAAAACADARSGGHDHVA